MQYRITICFIYFLKKYMNPNNILITITWPSWVGKSSIINYLIKKYPEKYTKLIAFTTRKPRPWEVHGIDYYFLSVEEFRYKYQNWDILLSYISYWNFYGHIKKELTNKAAPWKKLITDLKPEGVMMLNNHNLTNIDVISFLILAPTYKELVNRINGRNRFKKEDKKLVSRLEIGQEYMTQAREIWGFCEITNDNIKKCSEEIYNLCDS